MIISNDRLRDIGEFIPQPDDDILICRCEEITKGEIRRACHDGIFTMEEMRRYLRNGMGLCQGQTCSKLVKGIMARELKISPLDKIILPKPNNNPLLNEPSDLLSIFLSELNSYFTPYP